mmetsp:Transcript_40316/g.43743  ORF Transcript_40316/g.43743 Transcript_40316/m.43743 type:complete len:393 (+) Transcript_40316:118-1296(+)
MANSCYRKLSIVSLLSSSLFQLLLVFGYDDNRSIFSSAMNIAATTSSSSSSSSSMQVTECAIVGVGVLGTSLCKQLLRDPDFKNWKFTGITKGNKRHDGILEEVLGRDHDQHQYSDRFELRTADDYNDDTYKSNSNKKFNHCVFCAPPSGFDDYPSAVRGAINNLWMGRRNNDNEEGIFVFTSSGGIYGNGGNDDIDVASVVTESSILPSNPIPRIERLISAENEVLKKKGGSVLRLAGLYKLDRGAHNFWLGDTTELAKKDITGRADSLINLLHYDDAAGSVVAALKRRVNNDDDDDSKMSTCNDDKRIDQISQHQEGEIFLVSDGHPLTRQQICDSSLKHKRYEDRTIPKFVGLAQNGDSIGKIYDGSYTNKALHWKPRYESFDAFMSSS